jgi:hypothetical protein
MQRPQTCGMTVAGETKWRAMRQSLRRQTIMMARRFTAERCTNASIPALRLDASTLAAPLKYNLLETSGTSPSSSSATYSSTLPKPMDPSASSAAVESSSGVKHRGRPPGSKNKAKVRPGGHSALAAPCASVRRGRARRITPPRGPPVP